jgi:hypothetical protein
MRSAQCSSPTFDNSKFGVASQALEDHLFTLRRAIVEFSVTKTNNNEEKDRVAQEIEEKIRQAGSKFGIDLDFIQGQNNIVNDIFRAMEESFPTPLSVSLISDYLS